MFAATFELNFSSLGGIQFIVDNFLGFISLISFSIAHKETCLNQNLFRYSAFCLMKMKLNLTKEA